MARGQGASGDVRDQRSGQGDADQRHDARRADGDRQRAGPAGLPDRQAQGAGRARRGRALMASAAPPSPATDPRPGAEPNLLPIVARPRGGAPAWVLLLVALGLGLVLFAILDARRRSLSAPAV